jgi:hypothetical protein
MTAPNGYYRALVARWCNGNTEAFGAFIHGSNPCRAAIVEVRAIQRTAM